jgi:predicted transcriptional regulator of viral defense system
MKGLDRLAQLQRVGRPVLATREAAMIWDTSLPTAARLLSRWAESGVIVKIAHGVWHITRDVLDPAVVLPVLTYPYLSYLSGWSALSRHGMIEQLPRAVFAVSLDRAKMIDTAIGRFEIHHIHPALYGGFEGASGIRSGLATPEKALFDTVYLFAARNGTVTLPEVELPPKFDEAVVQEWIGKVPSARLRTLTATNLERILATAGLHVA